MNSTIIELANLKLETKQAGKVIFPSNIYDEKYIGPLYGYYVPETNVFNVIPTDTLHANNGKCSLLGYILPANPLKDLFLDEEKETPEKIIQKEVERNQKMTLFREKLSRDLKTGNFHIPPPSPPIELPKTDYLIIREKFIPKLIELLRYNDLLRPILDWVEDVFILKTLKRKIFY